MRRSVRLFAQDNSPTKRLVRFLTDIKIPGTTLHEIDAALQARFFQKKAGTNEPLERWELNAVEVECPQERILQHLSFLGFADRSRPAFQNYAYAGWPGAMAVRSAARLHDLIAAWEAGTRWNQLVVFAGSRPLDLEKESFERCVSAVGKEPTSELRRTWDAINPQTEAQMMQFQWSVTDRPMSMVAMMMIDAPMKPNPKPDGKPIRPNSEDPVHLWLKDHSPAPGSMLFSSGAPYGMAQDEAMWMILGPLGFEIDTFGHAAPENLGIEALMREVAGTVNRIKRSRLPS